MAFQYLLVLNTTIPGGYLGWRNEMDRAKKEHFPEKIYHKNAPIWNTWDFRLFFRERFSF